MYGVAAFGWGRFYGDRLTHMDKDVNAQLAQWRTRARVAVAVLVVLVIVLFARWWRCGGNRRMGFGDLMSFNIRDTSDVSERDLLGTNVPLWSVRDTYTGRRSYIGAPTQDNSYIDMRNGAPRCAPDCSASHNIEYVQGGATDDGIPAQWVLPSTPMETWNTKPKLLPTPTATDTWMYTPPTRTYDQYGLTQTALRGGQAVDLPALGGVTPDTEDIFALTEPDHDPLVN